MTEAKAATVVSPPGVASAGQEPGAAAWRAVASIAVATFVMVTTEFLPIGLLTAMASNLGVSEGRMGLAVTVPGVVAAVAAPALTVLAGRLDRRLVLLGLTLFIVASNLVVALAPNLSVLLIGRVLLGLNVGGFWAFAIAAGRRLVPEASGGRATSIISAGISIGTVCGVPAGSLVGHIAGWRVAFAVAGALSVLVLLAQMALLPKIRVTQAIGVSSLLDLFKVRQARIGLVATFLVAAGHFAAYTYFEPFLRHVTRMDQAMVTTALVLYGVAGIAGTFLGEAATARSVRLAFIGTALLLGFVVLLAPAIGSSTGLALGLVVLWGLAFGAVPVCVNIWMYQAAPGAYEGGSALIVTVFQIALASGAFGGGLVVDDAGLTAAFLVAGVTVASAGGVIVLLGGQVDQTTRTDRGTT
jgi:predicted MFS family arabinose efflux permease